MAVLASLVSARAASADPVTITSGQVDGRILIGTAVGSLEGDGFRLTFGAEGFLTGLVFDCVPCLPGTTVSLTGEMAHTRASGSAEVDGVEYPTIFLDGMSGTFTSPAFVVSGDSTVTITQPFSFTGQVSGYLVSPFVFGNPPAVFTKTLSGQGTASATFIRVFTPETGPIFTATNLRYEFEEHAPVPEPTTWILVGAGLLGAMGAKRRRRTFRT